MRTGVVGLTLALALTYAAPPMTGHAQDLAEAERLYREGVRRSADQRWGEAAEYFRRALAIVERPSIVCNLGAALFRLGEATDARRALERCIEISARDGWATSHAEQIEAAREALRELSRTIGRLRLEVEPADARVTLDGRAVPGSGAVREIEIDPGRHALAVEAEGHATHREEISVLTGATASRTIRLSAILPIVSRDPTPGGGGTDTAALGIGIAVAIVGAGGLATSGITFAARQDAVASRDRSCDAAGCDPAALDHHARAQDFNLATNVAIVGGAIALGAGALIVTVAIATGGSSTETAASARVRVGPGSIAAELRW